VQYRSITTNQAAIIALFRVVNRYVGNLPPMPGVFPDYPAPVVRNVGLAAWWLALRPFGRRGARTMVSGARWSPAQRAGDGRTIRSAAAWPRDRWWQRSRCRCGRTWRSGRAMNGETMAVIPGNCPILACVQTHRPCDGSTWSVLNLYMLGSL
jgi:hypothetical protein